MDEVEKALNDHETKFRNSDEFEQDHTNTGDIELFREACGLKTFVIEEQDSLRGSITPVSRRSVKSVSRGRASFAKPRMSTGSSVSSIKTKISKMDSIEEGDEESGDDNSVVQPEHDDDQMPGSRTKHTPNSSSSNRVDKSSATKHATSLSSEKLREDPGSSDDDSTIAPPNTRRKRAKHSMNTMTSISSVEGSQSF